MAEKTVTNEKDWEVFFPSACVSLHERTNGREFIKATLPTGTKINGIDRSGWSTFNYSSRAVEAAKSQIAQGYKLIKVALDREPIKSKDAETGKMKLDGYGNRVTINPPQEKLEDGTYKAAANLSVESVKAADLKKGVDAQREAYNAKKAETPAPAEEAKTEEVKAEEKAPEKKAPKKTKKTAAKTM